MGELVDLEEYRKKKELEETLKIQEELKQLKEQVEDLIQPKYIPVFPQEEYFHWHPPHLITYYEYESDTSWGNPETYELMIDGEFDWEKS